MIHAVAWYVWLGCVLVATSLTRNPLYLLLLLAKIALVIESLCAPSTVDDSPIIVAPGRFTFFVVPAGILFNAFTTHTGKTVLFSLPDALPLLGGPITLEGAVFGAINGMVLAAFFTAFTVLNLAVPIRDLIRLVPRAFYPVAVVVSIAITFVPTTRRQIQQIREAQAVRGHRMRGWRDWLPLFMPLLIGGLERAMQLAETLTARGFAAENKGPHAPGMRLELIGALFLLISGGLLHWVWALSLLGWGCLIFGLLVLGNVLWQAGQHVIHTRYRRTPWTRKDLLIIIAALLAILPLLLKGANARAYTPYPTLVLPPFDILVGLAFLGLTLPARLSTSSGKRNHN